LFYRVLDFLTPFCYTVVVESKQGVDKMATKDNQELQRQTLYVQLKILKELRLLNKTLAKGVHNPFTRIESQTLTQGNFDDVKDALALTGRNFI